MFFHRIRGVRQGVLVVALSFMSCKATSPGVQDALVAEGFLYLGRVSRAGVPPADIIKLPHSLDAQELANSIDPDYGYIYALRSGKPMEAVGSEVLPVLMERIGCKVLLRPGPKEFVYPLLGGPEFTVRVECAGRRYRIDARVSPYLYAKDPERGTVLILVRED